MKVDVTRGGTFLNQLKQMVYKILKKENLLNGQWHLGKVTQTVSSTQLKVFVDGGEIAQTVACNPDVTFNLNDEIWVVYINGNPRDKFAICKRAIL